MISKIHAACNFILRPSPFPLLPRFLQTANLPPNESGEGGGGAGGEYSLQRVGDPVCRQIRGRSTSVSSFCAKKALHTFQNKVVCRRDEEDQKDILVLVSFLLLQRCRWQPVPHYATHKARYPQVPFRIKTKLKDYIRLDERVYEIVYDKFIWFQ